MVGYLEQEVAVGEPARVAKANELKELGHKGDAVDGGDHSRRDPEDSDGASAVDDHGGLVLDLVPSLRVVIFLPGEQLVNVRGGRFW